MKEIPAIVYAPKIEQTWPIVPWLSSADRLIIDCENSIAFYERRLERLNASWMID